MAIVMDMTSYKIEPDTSVEVEYGDEIACAGWNPALSLAYHEPMRAERRAAMPVELADVDVEKFLQKMYTLMR